MNEAECRLAQVSCEEIFLDIERCEHEKWLDNSAERWRELAEREDEWVRSVAYSVKHNL